MHGGNDKFLRVLQSSVCDTVCRTPLNNVSEETLLSRLHKNLDSHSTTCLHTAMRLIFLDTETTGIAPEHGGRIIEIACVEMIDGVLTGRHLHHILNLEQPIPELVSEITGFYDAMVFDKPRFSDIAPQLVEFVGGDKLVIHNAAFDMNFLRAEWVAVGTAWAHLIDADLVIDTLPCFQNLHPGARCSLNSLCERYGIYQADNEDPSDCLADAKQLARLWQAAIQTDS